MSDNDSGSGPDKDGASRLFPLLFNVGMDDSVLRKKLKSLRCVMLMNVV
jgi:hypothetical protein